MSDLFPERIETDRLLLTPLHESVDPLAYYRYCSRHEPDIEEVTSHLSWEPHATPKETAAFLDHVASQWADDEAASYLIRPREAELEAIRTASEGGGPDEIAGATGLTVDWERRTGSLGIWLRKPFWGRGYSGERAAALAELAFDRLDLELLAVTHVVGNEQSRRAIEKYVDRLGGQYDCLLRNAAVYDGEVVDQRRYTVTREQWTGSRD